MIDKFCEYLTNKIRKKMPEVNDEQAEIIMYGIQLIVGEIPKLILLFALGIIIGLGWQTLLAFLLILPYKVASGGFHLKTHIGCFTGTVIYYCGNAMVSSIINLPSDTRIVLIILNLILGVIMITKYAPADTINLPILTKKERRNKRILSYIFLGLNMIVAYCIPNAVISNILIFGTLIQTFSITKIAYILTKNEYGYENYIRQNSNA